ncbi:hypothetical protein AVEN_210727-1 [Araneus ventricosus]|uniref:Uncharacterized protein n=1 Tax=Araneus ventricosus TaxID=182803 RepID=A0A4Y2MJ96_ARAVE|nr:hypothetical protein AVEN_210727-1 [Araneus ventricosus]
MKAVISDNQFGDRHMVLNHSQASRPVELAPPLPSFHSTPTRRHSTRESDLMGTRTTFMESYKRTFSSSFVVVANLKTLQCVFIRAAVPNPFSLP